MTTSSPPSAQPRQHETFDARQALSTRLSRAWVCEEFQDRESSCALPLSALPVGGLECTSSPEQGRRMIWLWVLVWALSGPIVVGSFSAWEHWQRRVALEQFLRSIPFDRQRVK